MIKPLGNSMLCEAVDIEDTNIDLGRKFGDKQGWRVVEFGLNKSIRIPVLKSTVAKVAEPNLTVGKKADLVDENGVEYEYVEVEVEVDENGNEIGEVKKDK